MKTKLVLWGSNTAGERVLVASSLDAGENKVQTWIFPLEIATEDFYNRLINEWRLGREVPFPEPFQTYEEPLSITESFLPEGITVEKEDLVSRAQSEWHFVVLSAKLYTAYKDELEELKEKIEEMGEYEQALWEQLKGFWGRVQGQIQDKTLFHDHTKKLRDSIDGLFKKMKEFRKEMDKELESISAKNKEEVLSAIREIRDRIEQGLGLQPLFEELKNLQKKYRKEKFTKEDRKKVWDHLDDAFKFIKEKRFGPGFKKEYSGYERLKRRYSGLIAAIEKMERSVQKDKKEIEFQDRKISQSEGQLEAQLRQAKLKMVEERILSKQNKLEDMLKTRTELEERLRKEEKKELQKQKQEEIEMAKEKVKEKIADEIKHAAEEREQEAEKLEKAAEKLADHPKEKDPEIDGKIEANDDAENADVSPKIGDEEE